MIDPAFTAETELEAGLPEYAVVHALLAVVVRLERINGTLNAIAERPIDL